MVDLFVSVFGSGRPMLCLHGVESHGVRFVGLASRLPGVRVVAPDLRGHGRSPKHGPWTVEQHVDDLLPILRSLDGTDKPLLLGHSYGGLLAWELARATPGLIGGLVLVDPAIAVSEDLARASVTYERSSVGHSWPDVAGAFADFAVGRPASGQWAAALDAALAIAPGADGRLRPVVAPEAVLAAWRHMQEPLRDSGYAGPTLLVEAGRENGRFVSADVLGQLRAALGDRLDHVVLDATHTIPTDYPAELAAAVSDFLVRHPQEV